MSKTTVFSDLLPPGSPRSFCIPGRRIKLHPDDYYALGGERGGIDERWLGCTTPADNGPLTGKNEGISHLVADDGTLVPLTEAAKAGVRIVNESSSDPIVMLKHFGPENPDWVKQFA